MINLIVIFRKAKQSQQCQMFLVNTWQHPAARVGAFSFFSFFLPMSHISGLSHTNIQNIQNASNFKSIFAASPVFSAVLDALLCISQVQRWGTTCTSGGFPRLQGWEPSWQEDKRVESVPFGIQHNSTTLSHGFESLTKSSQAWFLRRHCQTSGAVSKRQVSKNLAGLNGAILSENMQKYARLAVKAATGRSNKAFKALSEAWGLTIYRFGCPALAPLAALAQSVDSVESAPVCRICGFAGGVCLHAVNSAWNLKRSERCLPRC